MTIIDEEKLSIKSDSCLPFESIRNEVLTALRQDQRIDERNAAKIRIARSGASFREFQALIDTISLVPFNRSGRSGPKSTGDEE